MTLVQSVLGSNLFSFSCFRSPQERGITPLLVLANAGSGGFSEDEHEQALRTAVAVEEALLEPASAGPTAGIDFPASLQPELGKAQITLEAEVEAALVFGNRLREKQPITNRAGSCAAIGMNVVSRR